MSKMLAGWARPILHAARIASPNAGRDGKVESKQEHGRLDLVEERERRRMPDVAAVVPPDLLMTPCPAVTLSPEATKRNDPLLHVDRRDVVSNAPMSGEVVNGA